MLEKILARTGFIEKALDASWLRNEVIAHNIANVDTPGYKKKTVAFEEYFNDYRNEMLLKGPEVKRVIDQASEIEPKVRTDYSKLSTRLDGNNVDIEAEMALMAKNTIKYNTLIQRISGSFRSIKTVINEGRR